MEHFVDALRAHTRQDSSVLRRAKILLQVLAKFRISRREKTSLARSQYNNCSDRSRKQKSTDITTFQGEEEEEEEEEMVMSVEVFLLFPPLQKGGLNFFVTTDFQFPIIYENISTLTSYK